MKNSAPNMRHSFSIVHIKDGLDPEKLKDLLKQRQLATSLKYARLIKGINDD